VNYFLESKNGDGKWVHLCRIDTLSADVYSVLTPQRAQKLDLDKYGFDRLASKAKTLGQGDSLSGWTFFFNPAPDADQPKDGKIKALFVDMRITLVLLDGRRITVPVAPPISIGGTPLINPTIDWVPGYVDLTSLLAQDPYIPAWCQ
jgi:hypothetical protein